MKMPAHPPPYQWHFEMVPIDKIFPKEIQNLTGLEELKADIKKNGLKHNLTLRIDINDGTYHIVDGCHRIMALRKLGWTEVPCMVFDVY